MGSGPPNQRVHSRRGVGAGRPPVRFDVPSVPFSAGSGQWEGIISSILHRATAHGTFPGAFPAPG
eukprot:5852386-Heterocapsa_arctica.AAC.1